MSPSNLSFMAEITSCQEESTGDVEAPTEEAEGTDGWPGGVSGVGGSSEAVREGSPLEEEYSSWRDLGCWLLDPEPHESHREEPPGLLKGLSHGHKSTRPGAWGCTAWTAYPCRTFPISSRYQRKCLFRDLAQIDPGQKCC